MDTRLVPGWFQQYNRGPGKESAFNLLRVYYVEQVEYVLLNFDYMSTHVKDTAKLD